MRIKRENVQDIFNKWVTTMNELIEKNNLGEKEVIVWLPFIVKVKDLQPAMMPAMQMLPPAIPQPLPLPDPITVQPDEPPPVLLPPASTSSQQTDVKPRKGPASDKQMEWIHNILRDRNMTTADVCQFTGVQALEQLTKAQASAFINKYKSDKSVF